MTSNRHASLRVLLVEDSLPVRLRVRSLIEESLTVTIVGEAGTAVSALELFQEHNPDAVVLDLHLAEGTGFFVLAEIKRIRPSCVVIVLTNFPNPEYRERCQRLGAEHFFDKTKEFELVVGALEQSRAGVPPASDGEAGGKGSR